MASANDPKLAERILILVPTPRDAAATCEILRSANLHVDPCDSLVEVCREAERAAGAALLTEESILTDQTGCLATLLRNQPNWSDFPLIVLTRAGLDPRTSFSGLRSIGRMTLVQRPVQIASLVSTLEAAIRDRRRQYALRDYLQERDRVEETLRETDRRKDEFLAMLAHELRNPLAAVRTAVTLLRQGQLNRDEYDWMLQVLDRQVSQLNRLIDDLLDVSRVTRGKIELKKTLISTKEIVERALQVVQPLIRSSGHELLVRGPNSNDPLWLEADPARLEQVLVNLLTNAAKYTPTGGHVWLTYGREGDRLCLSVRDDGLGIEPDMLGRIFEMFTQVRHSLDRSEGGLGIGLTVVQRIVQMHNGTVEAHSEGTGKGSEFFVCLPLAEPPRDAPAEAAASTSGETGRRILIVDDNRDSASTLGLLLRRAGFYTAVAYDGLTGIKLAEKFQPSVALLDIGLPGMDGYELARRLRKHADLKDTLLVAVSGYGQPEDRRHAREAGFQHHLVKPVNIDELLGLISDHSTEAS